jgi:hypothetical protein
MRPHAQRSKCGQRLPSTGSSAGQNRQWIYPSLVSAVFVIAPEYVATVGGSRDGIAVSTRSGGLMSRFSPVPTLLILTSFPSGGGVPRFCISSVVKRWIGRDMLSFFIGSLGEWRIS